MAQYTLGIDIGGTFTDLVLFDQEGRRLHELKVPTTRGQTTRGLMEGIRRMTELAGIGPHQIAAVAHGTTTGTNAILERKGHRVALITTSGCRYVLEIGRHDVPKDVNMYVWRKPDKLVRPRDIFEVTERLDPTGQVVTPLNLEEAREGILEIRERRIPAIAVCFLYSYANPAHERAVRDLCAEIYPEAAVTCSSEVLPVFREYERTMATVINTYLLPLFRDYEGELEAGLADLGARAPVRIMQSNGGLHSLKSATRRPVTTILSGPAAGVIGAQFVGRLAGRDRLISLDIGGTSADIALMDGRGPQIHGECELAGLPLHVPMVDMKSIGAGGGSIARVTLTGSLTVGPDSAGSEPGPACYDRGGTEATVTDAHLVLGHLGTHLLDGKMELRVDLARSAVQEHVAKPMELSVEEAAAGILSVINQNMAGTLREVSVERGHDPKNYTLVAFGGAGPLHASMLCRLLGMRSFIAPANSGVLSAVGLLATDIRADFPRTSIQQTASPEPGVLTEIYSDLETSARRWLAEENADATSTALLRQADLRYRHQGYEVTTPVVDGPLSPEALQAVKETFDREHERLYGYAMPGAPVEWVTMRVTAVGHLPKVDAEVFQVGLRSGRAQVGTRQVYSPDVRRFVSAPIYDGTSMPPGERVRGPAIVELPTATVLLLAGDAAAADAYGNILVEVMCND